MILKTHIKIISVSIFIILSSCKDNPECLKSTGKIIKEDRSLPSFQSISIKDNLNIILTNDTFQTITVEGGEHLLPEIKTEVENGQLKISNENSCNWVRSYKKSINIFLNIKNVRDIFHYGSGEITSRETIVKDTIIFHQYSSGNINIDLNSNYIWLDMDKLGDFTITGKTNYLLARTIGLGQLNTDGLSCKQFYQTSDGQGSSNVRSDSLISVEINNSANIYYSGNPVAVIRSGSGSGNLVKK